MGQRMSIRTIVIALAVGLAGCGSSSHRTTSTRGAATATPAPATGTLVATLTTPPGHTPAANKVWPITVTARDPSGHAVRARLHYEFLYGGAVVARRSNFSFSGRFHDNLSWPAQAVGLPLTLRAVVTSAIGTKNLDYPVTVTR